MNEERLFILKMLEEGKINAQQAAALLEALEIGAAEEHQARGEAGQDSGSGAGETREPASDRPGDSEDPDEVDREDAGRSQGTGPDAEGAGPGDEASEGDASHRQEEARRREEHERGWGAFSRELAQQIRESIQTAMRGVPQITEELKENLQDVREEIAHSLKEVREEIKKGPLVDVSGLKHLFANVFGRGPGHQYEEQIKGVWAKGVKPRVECATKNGGITVVGWDEPYYRLTVRKWVYWQNEEEAKRIASEAVQVTTSDDGLQVICREGERVGASIELMLPKDYVYTLSARSTNGGINWDELEVIKAHAVTTNGGIRLKRVRGQEIEAVTTNGRIACEGVHAQRIEARTTNGGIHWEGSALEAELVTTNGGIRLVPSLPGMPAREAQDTAAGGDDDSMTGRYTAATTNAGIHVKLPADPDLGVRFEAKGRGVDLTGEKHRFVINGDLRHGATQFVSGGTPGYENARRRMSFRLTTTNGSIRFETDRSQRDGDRDADEAKGDA